MHPLQPVIDSTSVTLDMLYATVRRMPADKLEWSPLGEGRTVMSQLQECASAPDMFLSLLDPNHVPMFASFEEAMAGSAKWTTVDECEKITRELTAKLTEVILTLQPEQLGEKRTLPWGAVETVGAIAAFHNWNMTYHIGQINYIQTLYGDKAMF